VVGNNRAHLRSDWDASIFFVAWSLSQFATPGSLPGAPSKTCQCAGSRPRAGPGATAGGGGIQIPAEPKCFLWLCGWGGEMRSNDSGGGLPQKRMRAREDLNNTRTRTKDTRQARQASHDIRPFLSLVLVLAHQIIATQQFCSFRRLTRVACCCCFLIILFHRAFPVPHPHDFTRRFDTHIP